MCKRFVKMRDRCVKMCEIALKRKEILTFLAWAGMMPKYDKHMTKYDKMLQKIADSP